LVNGRIKASKLGWVRMRMSQPVAGSLRNVSLTREGAGSSTRLYASIQVQVSETLPALGVAPTLGIDLGVAAFAATSEGVVVAPLKALARQQVRLRRYQRAVSRKKKGSANRRKAAERLGCLHRRIARQRSNWLHELTTELAGRHPVIALEDLRVKNMSASARGTADQPGKNVAAKAALNRGILDAAWGEFTRQISYKLQSRGGQVVLVNPAYTSRTCRICGHEAAENRKTQAVFSCVACGHTGERGRSCREEHSGRGARGLAEPRLSRCLWRRGQSRSTRKGEARSSVEAGTHRRDLPCVARRAR
jgi:putative transposase